MPMKKGCLNGSLSQILQFLDDLACVGSGRDLAISCFGVSALALLS